MLRYLAALPFALPAFALGATIAGIFSKRLGRQIHEHPAVVFLWLASLSLILAATLTPSSQAFEAHEGLRTTRVWIWSLPSPGALTHVNWQSMNLLLFAPAGFASGLYSRRRNVMLFGSLALLSSLAVEVVQYLLIPLGRAQFNSATVIIGWTGITAGALVGALVSALYRRGQSRAAAPA
ncbi:hypothetical protein SB749_01395 [Brevibacterium sp. SIMBA_078]|uniref:hypothetical protein n=1 Tax=Brevibacterium sp. SIMBA_078 TaxID=3085816 RepID=UPI00397ADFE0